MWMVISIPKNCCFPKEVKTTRGSLTKIEIEAEYAFLEIMSIQGRQFCHKGFSFMLVIGYSDKTSCYLAIILQ